MKRNCWGELPEDVPLLLVGGCARLAPSALLPSSSTTSGTLPAPAPTCLSSRWSPHQVYDIVAAVEHYHKFVPW